ncbi:hypothetical protein DF23_001529 [Xylella fastidiosa]|nr:hypothetical protein [Xylella fastidiosa]
MDTHSGIRNFITVSPYVGVNGWHIFAYIPLEEGTPSNVIGVAEKAGSVGGEAIAGQVCSSTLSVLLPLRLHGAQVGRYPTSASSAGGKAGAPVSTGAMSLRSGGREVWCDSCSGHGWSAAWHVVLRCWAVGLLGCCGGRSRRNLVQIGVDAATVQFAAGAEGRCPRC